MDNDWVISPPLGVIHKASPEEKSPTFSEEGVSHLWVCVIQEYGCDVSLLDYYEDRVTEFTDLTKALRAMEKRYGKYKENQMEEESDRSYQTGWIFQQSVMHGDHSCIQETTVLIYRGSPQNKIFEFDI